MVFGLVAALVCNLNRSPAWRTGVLGLASVVFLAVLAGSPLALLPLFGFLLLGYGALLLVTYGLPRAVLCGVVTLTFAYAWLKGYTFLPQSLLLHSTYFTLGLSYIFFRVLHLLIATGDSDAPQPIGLPAYLLYMLNFTTLVCGPIQPYAEFARDQFAPQPIALGPRVVASQLERIVRGFFKVNVLALLLQMLQADAIARVTQPLPNTAKVAAALQLTALYPLFLYANFSGYIDIVIALARLMRLRLPENFARPFAAPSVLDFWNRWHMTLSNWLKTYVYNPLMMFLMSRITALAAQPLIGVFCFFVTFFLIGVWHGRTSEFIMFGLLTGVGVSINKLWQLGMGRWLGRKGYKEVARNPIYLSLGRGLNLTWFSFTLLWFWADWAQIRAIFAALGPAQWLVVVLAGWGLASILLAAWEWLRAATLSIRGTDGPILESRHARVVYATALALLAVVITLMLKQPAPGIVYKAF